MEQLTVRTYLRKLYAYSPRFVPAYLDIGSAKLYEHAIVCSMLTH